MAVAMAVATAVGLSYSLQADEPQACCMDGMLVSMHCISKTCAVLVTCIWLAV